MKAIIVAAGRSSRLYPLTLDTPKPLLKINGLSIIENSINNLYESGVCDIAVVTGYLKEQFLGLLKDRVRFFENPFYAFTNDMASFWCARDFVKDDDFLYIHGDLVLHPDIIKKCLDKKGAMVLVVDKKICDEEDMKVRLEKGVFAESSKEIPLEKSYGEWIGLAKFSKEAGLLVFNEIENILSEGRVNEYDSYAFTRLAQHGKKIDICHTDGFFWAEIDTMKELERVRGHIR